MNKEEREICKLEDNFVSFIDNFIVSFSKYMKILSWMGIWPVDQVLVEVHNLSKMCIKKCHDGGGGGG